MDAYWILPNREQRDSLLASDGMNIVPLRELLSPASRPAGFSHGVPTEILEKVPSAARDRILFAQRFPKSNDDKLLFSISTPAGTDRSGRTVHLGLIFVLAIGETPRFNLPIAALPDIDKETATRLLRRLTTSGRDDRWAESVRALFQASPELGPATNVALRRSATPFESLYALRRDGLVKKDEQRRQSRLALLDLLTLLTILAVSLYLRSLHSGALMWHFN